MGDIFPDPYYNNEKQVGEYNKPTSKYVYHDRNYYLFGILAGVRGDGPAIKKPRGVPKDASEEYLTIVNDWDGDGHNHHWYTLKELLNYNWYKKYKQKGYVSVLNYKWFEKNKTVETYIEYVPEGYEVISNEDMKSLCKKVKDTSSRTWHNKLTLLEWETSKADYCVYFIESIKYMKLLGEPDKVRMVFFFDN